MDLQTKLITLVRKMHSWFPWAQGHLQAALETAPVSRPLVWARWLLSLFQWSDHKICSLITHEESNFCSEQSSFEFRGNTRK